MLICMLWTDFIIQVKHKILTNGRFPNPVQFCASIFYICTYTSGKFPRPVFQMHIILYTSLAPSSSYKECTYVYARNPHKWKTSSPYASSSYKCSQMENFLTQHDSMPPALTNAFGILGEEIFHWCMCICKRWIHRIVLGWEIFHLWGFYVHLYNKSVHNMSMVDVWTCK